ncbi:putative aldouronate transport system permease protein [Anaerobacterium chartisolvens]|uniref:Putative aldouronate transport system permease protein n=1 Tax=Anaerobacterium chartisolvens TaxID=1297424 RepID=A0A369AL60_9FIRM|nr:carbohydrate ABC transporter permease [Anaerobacterium chartisolvens]RCX09911.1 putative aldouronate transport system permease protein [Anaerobacterium chartisolvens]
MKIAEDRGIRAASHIILGLFSIACVLPFVLLIIASFTDELVIGTNGYSFFPEKFSLTAYMYLWAKGAEIGRAYFISVFITVVGTLSSLAISAMLSYPLSRRDLPHRKILNFYVVFTMLFNGGLVPTYLVYTQYFHIKNTIWALLIPTLLLNGFTVMLMRTFFSTNIPSALLESAKIDGAGEIKTFMMIVIPMSLPILATIGLLSALMYWNDWFNGLIYLTDQKLYSLQNVLNRIMIDIQFLQTTNTGNQSGLSTTNLPAETVRMAMAAVGVVPILCAYPFFQKYFVKGIALGAVKG